MFVRARPEVNIELLERVITGYYSSDELECDDDKLYFNSGSSALKWFLLMQKNIINKKLNVAVQVFTCSSVRNSIVESGNEIIFVDTDPKLLSSSLDDVILATKGDVDILILSHLFGVVNAEYMEIKSWCEKHKIILINDLAQTVDAKVNFKTIESYGDYYFYSYSFDKPISIGDGGALKIKETDVYMKKEYLKLSEVSKAESIHALKKLGLYYILTAPDIYVKEFRYSTMIENAILSILPISFFEKYKSSIYIILSSRLNFLMFKFFGRKSSSINILRLNNISLYYLNNISFKEKIKESRSRSLDILKDNLCKISTDINFDFKSVFNPRYPLFTTNRNDLVELLYNINIESGNHNWSELICNKEDYYKYPKSCYILERIVNVPIWNVDIWNIEK